MDAGNSLEIVSKYMGHKSADTTNTHYWVANAQELHDNLKNPITGSYQEQTRDEEIKIVEIAVLRKKKARALEVITQVLGALDAARNEGGGADDVLSNIKNAVPNFSFITDTDTHTHTHTHTNIINILLQYYRNIIGINLENV